LIRSGIHGDATVAGVRARAVAPLPASTAGGSGSLMFPTRLLLAFVSPSL
jgi:hypothetical protein